MAEDTQIVSFKNSGVLDLYWRATVAENEVAPNPAWPAGASIVLEDNDVLSGPLAAGIQQNLNLTVNNTDMLPANSPYMATVSVRGYSDAAGTEFIEVQELNVLINQIAYPLYTGTVNYNWYATSDTSWGAQDDNYGAVYTPASDREYYYREPAGNEFGFRLVRDPITLIWNLTVTKGFPVTATIYDGPVDCDMRIADGYPSGEHHVCRNNHYYMFTWGPDAWAKQAPPITNHDNPFYFASIKGKWLANGDTSWGVQNHDVTLALNESCPGVHYRSGSFGGANNFRLGLTYDDATGLWMVRATKGNTWAAPQCEMHNGVITITQDAELYPDGSKTVTSGPCGFAGGPSPEYIWSFGRGVW